MIFRKSIYHDRSFICLEQECARYIAHHFLEGFKSFASWRSSGIKSDLRKEEVIAILKRGEEAKVNVLRSPVGCEGDDPNEDIESFCVSFSPPRLSQL